jgi:TATA-box binding protein (TBP) (component of TFIID and TFIIIB)
MCILLLTFYYNFIYFLTFDTGKLLVDQAKTVLTMKKAVQNVKDKMTKHKTEVNSRNVHITCTNIHSLSLKHIYEIHFRDMDVSVENSYVLCQFLWKVTLTNDNAAQTVIYLFLLMLYRVSPCTTF